MTYLWVYIRITSYNVCYTKLLRDLCEYLIKTYSNEGDIVLDNCIGSGTTAISAINTNRNYIGFELDKNYFDIANKRIEEHIQNKL